MKDPYKTGMRFREKVSSSIMQTDNGFVGSISIGDAYYETDPYKERDSAIKELIGFLDGVQYEIDEELKKLKIKLK